jgi:hypothetical protein
MVFSSGNDAASSPHSTKHIDFVMVFNLGNDTDESGHSLKHSDAAMVSSAGKFMCVNDGQPLKHSSLDKLLKFGRDTVVSSWQEANV